jgi:hypothetical protein
MKIRAGLLSARAKTDSGDSRQGGGDEESRGKTTVRPNQNPKPILTPLRIKKPLAQQTLN